MITSTIGKTHASDTKENSTVHNPPCLTFSPEIMLPPPWKSSAYSESAQQLCPKRALNGSTRSLLLQRVARRHHRTAGPLLRPENHHHRSRTGRRALLRLLHQQRVAAQDPRHAQHRQIDVHPRTQRRDLHIPKEITAKQQQKTTTLKLQPMKKLYNRTALFHARAIVGLFVSVRVFPEPAPAMTSAAPGSDRKSVV